MNSHSTAAVQAARHLAVSFVAAVSAVGLTAPHASAEPLAAPAGTAPRHAPQTSLTAPGIPFTDAKVTQRPDGSFAVSWKAPAVGSVTVYVGGRVVAYGGAEADVTVRGLPPPTGSGSASSPTRATRSPSPTARYTWRARPTSATRAATAPPTAGG